MADNNFNDESNINKSQIDNISNENELDENENISKDSKFQVVRSVMLKKVDLKELNAKIDQTYKENNNKIRFLVIIITLLVILLIVLSFKMGSIGYSPVALSEVDNITLKDENTVINHNARINIFGANKVDETQLINGFRVIYPSIKGEYKFSVKNTTMSNMKYNVEFTEYKDLPINMKYKLKMDNIYIKGDKDHYVSLKDINLNEIIVPSNSINIYTLEWCWVEDDEIDNQIAKSNTKGKQYYTLSMKISSTPYFN